MKRRIFEKIPAALALLVCFWLYWARTLRRRQKGGEHEVRPYGETA
ncbi:MAG: hypothetical protein FWC62_01350 [Firmicutes bacterium]|nr:hypothetical protein [Bacillota bacterium]